MLKLNEIVFITNLHEPESEKIVTCRLFYTGNHFYILYMFEYIDSFKTLNEQCIFDHKNS